ncbi:transient receptor potential cation channel subfamily M member 5-like [Ptychodera flava]|uniref:transient receptor potential cation channel subfamily M member 5-like n=1 Tax=Ptychodera flava TaxID=63121 RepID=UPI00396A2802
MDQPSNSNSFSIFTFPPTNEDEERVTEFYHYSGEEVETLRRIRTDLKLEGRKRLFVFSISGGTETQQPILKAKLENRLKTEFREIFVNDGRTLVITSGVDRGVVHTVGETLKSMDASDKKRLTCLGIMPDDTPYFIDCDLKTKEIVITTKDDESDALSPNRHHTHFLLLSHKEETNWLKKRTMFRQQLEQSLSNQAKEADKHLSFYFSLREDSNGYDEKVWADLLKHVKSYGHEMFDKEVEKDIKRDIKAIIKKKNQLRFYDWQLNTNASNASKDKKGHSLEEIIDEATCRDKENKLLLIEALRTQKTKRILKLLNGEKISALLHEQTVHYELYAKNKQGDRAEDDLDFRADKAVKKSIKQYYNLKYKSGQKQSTGDEQVTANENWNTTREISFRDIFLWAIITQRFDLAEYAWERLEEPIMASLVVSLAMKSVAEKVPQRQQKKKDDYTEISRKYERKAIEIIGIAHLSDAQKADKLLEDEHKCWNKFTCLEVAIGGKAKAFLSQDCCHYKLRKMWFGEIDVEESSPKARKLSYIFWTDFPQITVILKLNIDDQVYIKMRCIFTI